MLWSMQLGVAGALGKDAPWMCGLDPVWTITLGPLEMVGK